LDTDGLTVPENLALQETGALWPEHDEPGGQAALCFLQPLWCSIDLPPLVRLQTNKLTFKACAKFVFRLTAKRCCFALIDGQRRVVVLLGVLAVPARNRPLVFVLIEMLGHSKCTIAMPNV
jgi:hypothetical protein